MLLSSQDKSVARCLLWVCPSLCEPICGTEVFLIHPLLSYLGAVLSSYFRVTVIMLYADISLFCISISKGLPVGYLEIENLQPVLYVILLYKA